LNDQIVLVVDDDPRLLMSLQRLLWQNAYKSILYTSAHDFKSHRDFGRVSCVILDISPRAGSGLELAHDLRAGDQCVPVICMTGDPDPAVRKAALDTGCIAFLTKPFPAQSLLEPLKRALAQRVRPA
jgi:FixJ family two-component response regulator